jgi:hypothetical protein
VIVVFYGCVLGGVALLYLDVAGRLTVGSRVGLWRSVGVAAAAGPGLAPIIYAIREPTGYSGVIFPAISVAYLVAFLAFAIGAMDWYDRRSISVPLRRAGYAVLLALSAIPSFVLLILTVFVFVAGTGLLRLASTTAHEGGIGER